MKSFATALLVLVPASLVGVLVGCAEGTADGVAAEDFLATTPADAGETEKESVTIPPPSSPPSEDDDADAGSTVDAGSDAGGNTDAGGFGGVACTAPNTCASSVNLGSVRGDNGADTKSAQGHTSQWFTIRVTEDDHGVLGKDLWMTATLTSPPGTNFDLYLYVPETDTLACTAVSEQSSNASGTDSAAAKFGEGFSNGSDDSRTVTVEVRHVSGTCDPNKKWTLTVAGNK